MSRPKGSHDVMPKIRGGLKRALKMMAEEDRPISTIWKEMFEDDPFKAMHLAIQAMPKNVDIDINETVTHNTNQMSPELLREVINLRRLELEINDEKVIEHVP